MLTVQYGYFDLILTMGTSCSMHHWTMALRNKLMLLRQEINMLPQ